MSTPDTATPGTTAGTLPEPAPPAGQADTLTALDTCDADAASPIPAMVRLAHATAGELCLCKHHYEANAAALKAAGFQLTDDRRDTLT